MLFLTLTIMMLLCLSTVSAQQPTTPLPPVVVRDTPLPSEAIPDRLRLTQAGLHLASHAKHASIRQRQRCL
jgi:hypothetical protein